jgi:hypothetical protein
VNPELDFSGGIQTALPWAEYQPPLIPLEPEPFRDPWKDSQEQEH